MVARTFGRLIVVPLAFLLGAAAAALVLVVIGMERVTQAAHGREADFGAWRHLFEIVAGTYGLASVMTLAPAVLLVIAGEVARIRSCTYYVLGGGIALAALPLLARSGSLGEGIAAVGQVWQVFATAGFAGGLVYWMLAGRRA